MYVRKCHTACAGCSTRKLEFKSTVRSYVETKDFNDMITEVKNGANEIALSFLKLDVHPNGTIFVNPGKFNLSEFLETKMHLNEKGYNVRYLASLGGWNAPHAPTNWYNAPIEEGVKVFEEFNLVDPKYGGRLVDGIDWDYEGFDNLTNPEVCFTQPLLDFMGLFSVALVDLGYWVSMVRQHTHCSVYQIYNLYFS